MIEMIFSIKQVNVDAALKEAQTKAKNSAAKIDKSLQGAGKGAGKGVKDAGKAVKDKLEQAGKGMESINKLGGKMGGVFKNATEALTGMLSPIGLITAGITALVALGVKMWDKFTQSAEQYSQKVAIGAERAKKQQQDLNKAQAQDKGYLKRLQDLAKIENLSNAEKNQAAKLINILNRSYSNLGLSIDMATGKIKDLDNAQMEMLNRMKEIALQRAKNVANSQENVASDAVNKAAGKGGLWSNFAPITFGDPSKSMSVSMAHNWNNMDLRNGEKGLNELKTSFLSSDQVKNLATQLEVARKKAADLKAEMEKNPSAVSDADKQQLKTLQAEEKHIEKLLKLQQKLQVTQSMQRKAKTTQDIQNWHKAETEIKKYITTLKELQMQQDQKQLEKLQTLGKNAEYEREVKKYYDDHINNLNAEIKVQKLLNAGKIEAAERQKLINDLKKQGLTVDNKQLDLIMKKRKQLAGLKMKDAFSSEAEKLLATVGKQVNGKQAEFQQRVADYEQKYGVKLSKSQKNAIQTLIDVESEIADMPKLSFKGMEIKTDELTARGGNAGGAVAPDKNAVNAQIRDYSRNQVKLLTDIKQTLKNAGII